MSVNGSTQLAIAMTTNVVSSNGSTPADQQVVGYARQRIAAAVYPGRRQSAARGRATPRRRGRVHPTLPGPQEIQYGGSLARRTQSRSQTETPERLRDGGPRRRQARAGPSASRVNGSKSQRRAQPGRRDGRDAHRSQAARAGAAPANLVLHERDRVRVLHRRNGLPERQTLALRTLLPSKPLDFAIDATRSQYGSSGHSRTQNSCSSPPSLSWARSCRAVARAFGLGKFRFIAFVLQLLPKPLIVAPTQSSRRPVEVSLSVEVFKFSSATLKFWLNQRERNYLALNRLDSSAAVHIRGIACNCAWRAPVFQSVSIPFTLVFRSNRLEFRILRWPLHRYNTSSPILCQLLLI
jgi:hypothetical protein